jgi:hypothetical protein
VPIQLPFPRQRLAVSKAKAFRAAPAVRLDLVSP